MTVVFDGTEMKLDVPDAAELATVGRGLWREFETLSAAVGRRVGPMPPVFAEVLRVAAQAEKTAADIRVSRPSKKGFAPGTVDSAPLMTVAEVADMWKLSKQYVRAKAREDPELDARRRYGDHGEWLIPRSKAQELADRRAGRRQDQMVRVAIAAADDEIERLRVESAALAEQVHALELRRDNARREAENAADNVAIARERQDVMAEFRALETIDAAKAVLTDVEPEISRLSAPWAEVEARLDPLWRQQQTVTHLDDQISANEGLAAILDLVDKTAAAGQTWNDDRRAAGTQVGSSRLVDELVRLTRSGPYDAAQQRVAGTQDLRRQRGEAERVRVAAATTVEDSEEAQ